MRSGRNTVVSALNLKTSVIRAAVLYLCVGLPPNTDKQPWVPGSSALAGSPEWAFSGDGSPGSQTAGCRALFWAFGPSLSSSPTESSYTPWYGRTLTLRCASKHRFSLGRLVSKMKRNELWDKEEWCWTGKEQVLPKEVATQGGPSLCTPGRAQTIPYCWPMGPGAAELEALLLNA